MTRPPPTSGGGLCVSARRRYCQPMLIANIAPRSMGKTTDTGWMLHAFHEARDDNGAPKYRVRGYDADHSRQLITWAEGGGEFPMPVEAAATAKFHRQVAVPPGVLAIVDCGHTENHPDITDSVLRVADLVILHLTPSTADVERVLDPPVGVPIGDMVKRSAPLRPDGQAPPAWALFNRVKHKAGSTKECREWMEEEGWNVLSTTIPDRETLKQSVGNPIVKASSSPFGALVTELENRGLVK